MTVATVISVKMTAATTPMKQRTKSANLNLSKAAGPILFCTVVYDLVSVTSCVFAFNRINTFLFTQSQPRPVLPNKL